MSYGNNPYDTPEKFGLNIVAVLDESESYSWDLTVVWRDIATGALFWYSGAGCSCDSVSDEVYGLADLTPLDRDGDVNRLLNHVLSKGPSESRHRFLGEVVRAVKEPYTPPVLTTEQQLRARFPDGDAPVDEVAKFIDEELIPAALKVAG